MIGTGGGDSGREPAGRTALGPKKILKIARMLLFAATSGLLIYGLLRFSIMTAPEGIYGSMFDPGEKIIVDKFPSHGRSLIEGDWVVFKPSNSKSASLTIGKVLVLPSGIESEEEAVSKLKTLFSGESDEGIRTVLGMNAGKWPGKGHYLLGITVPQGKGEARLFLEWADSSAIHGRVIMRSPF